MKTIQEELGGVSQEEDKTKCCKSLWQKWDENQNISKKNCQESRMNPKRLILEFKEII
jgi:hypothetical protein